jgi:hypothetical protein
MSQPEELQSLPLCGGGPAALYQDYLPDERPTRQRLISARVRSKGHVWLRYEVRAS